MRLNPNEALGLPRGSVRAIIALGLVGAAIALVISGRPMTDAFGALVVSAVSFYFAGGLALSPPSENVVKGPAPEPNASEGAVGDEVVNG